MDGIIEKPGPWEPESSTGVENEDLPQTLCKTLMKSHSIGSLTILAMSWNTNWEVVKSEATEGRSNEYNIITHQRDLIIISNIKPKSHDVYPGEKRHFAGRRRTVAKPHSICWTLMSYLLSVSAQHLQWCTEHPLSETSRTSRKCDVYRSVSDEISTHFTASTYPRDQRHR